MTREDYLQRVGELVDGRSLAGDSLPTMHMGAGSAGSGSGVPHVARGLGGSVSERGTLAASCAAPAGGGVVMH